MNFDGLEIRLMGTTGSCGTTDDERLRRVAIVLNMHDEEQEVVTRR